MWVRRKRTLYSCAAARAGLDLSELDREIGANPNHFVDAIKENQQALEAAGHWGVPTMVFNGEPFFGQDRIDLLVWRIRQARSVVSD